MAHLSVYVIITCGDIYDECYCVITTLDSDGRCAAYDKTTIIGMYVAIKIKNPPLLWYKQSDIYETFRGKYVASNH